MKNLILETLVQDQCISKIVGEALGMATSKSTTGSYADDTSGT